jgi:ADP-ribose pyrophosphatase
MSASEMPPGWRLLGSQTLCDTDHLKVYQERVATPSRPDGVEWTVARRRTAAVVAPRTPEGKYILVRQERVAVRRVLWEFPAGQVDENELSEAAIRETALRELGEEAGVHTATALTALGYFYSSAGFTDECAHLFLATDVVPREDGSKHDEHEAIVDVRAFSVEELGEMITSNEIVDANTLSLYARLSAHGLLH